jgi:hypothetical protein
MLRVFRCLFCVAVLVGIALSPEFLLVQNGPPALKIEPIVDFSSVFSSLSSLVTTVVVGALGIGLAIWGTRFLFRLVKSMSRG